MASLALLGRHRRCGITALPSERTHRRAGVLVLQAQGTSGNDAAPVHQYSAAPSNQSQQPSGMYYGNNSSPGPQYAQPRPPPQYYQPQPQPGPQQQAAPVVAQPLQGAQPSYAPTNAPGYPQTPQYPSPQYPSPQYPQTPQYPSPQYPSPSGSAPANLTRVNPGRNHINSVRLMGTITMPERQGRCTYAIIQVPYATKEGIQEFLVEAWDADGANLMGMHGVQVLLDGRLARDAASGGVKVVANRIQLVDQTAPPTSYRGGQAGEGRAAAAPTAALDSQQLWKMHYNTSTRTLQELASHFGVQPATVGKALLPYAFQTKSPLHWGLLAEEAGLGPNDELRLLDFIDMVTQYKTELTAMYNNAKPGATPPPLPATQDGLLKVKPLREWALAKPESDAHHYIVKQYEAKHGLSKLYEALRMGVVAEGTLGVWSLETEFGPA